MTRVCGNLRGGVAVRDTHAQLEAERLAELAAERAARAVELADRAPLPPGDPYLVSVIAEPPYRPRTCAGVPGAIRCSTPSNDPHRDTGPLNPYCTCWGGPIDLKIPGIGRRT